MKMSYIKMYWYTVKNTAMWNQEVTVVAYGTMRELWSGTVGEFVRDTESLAINNDSWMVVSFGHPATTEADEIIPVYNRPIEIQVI